MKKSFIGLMTACICKKSNINVRNRSMKSNPISSIESLNQIRKLEQITLEDKYSKKGIYEKVKKDIENSPELVDEFETGVSLITKGRFEARTAYNSKRMRYMDLAFLSDYDCMLAILVALSAHENEWVPIQSVASSVANVIPLGDEFSKIKTAAELIAIAADTALYDISKPKDNPTGRLIVRANFKLDEKTSLFISNTMYRLPMVIEPQVIHTYQGTPYLDDIREDNTLGGRINRNEAIKVHTLNIANATALEIDEEVIKTPEPNPVEDPTPLQQRVHEKFLKEQAIACNEIISRGNLMYLTWAYDKRGRMYSRGHHINIQSTEYRKAMINLASKETIEVPDKFKL